LSIFKNLWVVAKTGFFEEEKLSTNQLIKSFFKLLLILFFFKFLYLAFTALLELIDGFILPMVSENTKLDDYSGLLKFTLTALLAPIVEEFTFRLGLKFSKRNFIIMIGGLTFVVLKVLLHLDWEICLAAVSFVILFLSLILKAKAIDSLAEFWKNHRLLIFYFLLLSFSVVHSTNFELSGPMLLYIPLLILPQIMGGLVYGYARFNHGILMSIGLHMASNGILTLPYLLSS
tara:strand:+ start:59 stop:754 length:696 start_codon:yes stop_codon:yes gene_type:complete